MNHNNHKNNIECTSKIIRENEKNKISSTDFILGDVFMEKYGQDCIDAENNNSILYSIKYTEMSYEEEVSIVEKTLGYFNNLEEACYSLIQYMKHAMMNGAREIKFDRNKLHNNKYRRGYSVITKNGITRIVIYELNFIMVDH